MHIQARIEVFQNITKSEEIDRIRRVFGTVVQAWTESNQLVYSGIFAGKRGGISIFDLGSNEELFELIGPVVDLANVELQPLGSVDTLAGFISKHPIK